jgi:predicted site-specific integrase-resolvase
MSKTINYLTRQEAADALGISTKTLDRRVQQGLITPAHVINPGIRRRPVKFIAADIASVGGRVEIPVKGGAK